MNLNIFFFLLILLLVTLLFNVEEKIINPNNIKFFDRHFFTAHKHFHKCLLTKKLETCRKEYDYTLYKRPIYANNLSLGIRKSYHDTGLVSSLMPT